MEGLGRNQRGSSHMEAGPDSHGVLWTRRSALSLIIGLTVSGARSSAKAGAAAASPTTPAAFPLRTVAGKRYLDDAAGKPFLIHGEAAWSLIAQLTREKVDLYLEDRQARGFNTVLVSLIEHMFCTNPPANAYGEQPFLTAGDYSNPNERYFAHADWVLQRAAEKGFLVLLVPSYLGSGGGPEGWYQEMVANGAARLHRYGQYLGRRYRDFANILWVHGADYNPPSKALVRAIADGIREFDPTALHSAQCAPETAALDYWRGESWLNVNSIYTYRPVYSAALTQYAHSEHLPFFLIESAYENEHGVTEQRLRAQAYQAVLSGAAGQIFGNNPIWHFDGPGIYPVSMTWQQAMGSRGTQSMTHLRSLLSMVPWWLLEPESGDRLLTGGLGSGYDRAVVACSTDRSLAIAYLPSLRKITFDLKRLTGPRIRARWYDPADGKFSDVRDSPFPAMGLQSFAQDLGRNSAGFEDWVLILESRS